MARKADPNSRRQQIGAALWRVAHGSGWDAVTMRQVAAEAGVSVGMVQHHFASKDEMLQFALDMIGEKYRQQTLAHIAALPQPHDPRQVVAIVLDELLPREGEGRIEVQAMAAFLTRAVLHPEIAAPLAAAGATLTGYVADQIRRHHPAPDAEIAAAGLIALTDGLIAHMFTRNLSLDTARAIVAAHLDHVFGPPPEASTPEIPAPETVTP